MKFLVSANSDIGNTRKTNQDAVSVLVADSSIGPVALAVICDGMGGLAKGEMASATLLHAFIDWFKNVLPQDINSGITDGLIKEQWNKIIIEQNEKIKSYGQSQGINLGTTVSAILITQERYYITNVGDSRVYEIYNNVRQITEDQTVVAQEIKYGRLTPEQAENDPRKSVLLQCVGASQVVNPDYFFGTTIQNATYMLCSDGFRHLISDDEIYQNFNATVLKNTDVMNNNSLSLTVTNKQRMEKDNITVALVKTY